MRRPYSAPITIPRVIRLLRQEDAAVTRRLLADAGKLLGIELQDHIVVGDDGSFVSLRERNMM